MGTVQSNDHRNTRGTNTNSQKENKTEMNNCGHFGQYGERRQVKNNQEKYETLYKEISKKKVKQKRSASITSTEI